MDLAQLEALEGNLISVLHHVRKAIKALGGQHPHGELDTKYAVILSTQDLWPASIAHTYALSIGIHARQIVPTLIRLGYRRTRKSAGNFWTLVPELQDPDRTTFSTKSS